MEYHYNIPLCDNACLNLYTLLTACDRNGQLKEYLNAGVSKPDFLQRVKIVLDNSNNSSPSGGALTPVSATEVPEAVPAEATQSQAVQNVLQERRARLEAAKKQQDAFEKAERAAKAAQRKEALENAAVSDPKKAADIKYAQLQKKRQQEARAERERILKRVEDDKAERRAKEALRKEQARVAAGEQSPHEASLTSQSTSIHSASTTRATECAIQVRLFDGTTIRSRFPCHKTLSKDVREWVDSKSANSGVPYNFKQISTPLPNRTIEMSEEEQTLQSLGLVPSATLVLIPIKDYTSAYQGGATGIVSRGLSAGFGLVTSGLGLVTGTLSSVLGSTAPTEAASGPERSPSPSETRSREHQLYNGNAVSPIKEIPLKDRTISKNAFS